MEVFVRVLTNSTPPPFPRHPSTVAFVLRFLSEQREEYNLEQTSVTAMFCATQLDLEQINLHSSQPF